MTNPPIAPPRTTGPTPSALAIQSKFAVASDSSSSFNAQNTFKPSWLFVYGTLMDPEILQAILNAQEAPKLRDATVGGFQLMMWGPYPAVVRNSSDNVNEICGKAYWLKDSADLKKLATYETQAYRCGHCNLRLDDNTSIKDARIFEWASVRDKAGLKEGSFDLEHFQRYFKPSMLRKRPM